jgi:hypothetical protein
MRGHERLFRKHYGALGAALYRLTVLVNSATRVVFWGALARLGMGPLDRKLAHFRRLVRWSVLGEGPR